MRFLVRNYFDLASLAASTEAGDLSVLNLQDQQRKMVWRATGCANEYVDIDMGQAVTCNALALVNHNLSTAGSISLLAGSTPGASDILSLSWSAWTPILTWGEFVWGDPRCTWDGCPADQELISDPLWIGYFEATSARYWRVKFLDPDNPAGYVQTGRIFLGPYLEPRINFSRPYEFEPYDPSRRKESLGGQTWTDERPRRYRLRLNFRVAEEDAWWGFVDMMRRVGVSRNFIVDCFPAGPAAPQWWMRLYCRMERTGPIKSQRPARGLLSLSMVETL